MFRWTVALALLGAFSLSACKTTAPETPAETPPAEKTTAQTPAEQPAAEAPAAEKPAVDAPTTEAAPTPPAGGALKLTRISGSDSAPATAYEGPPTSMKASADGAALRIDIERFVYHCSPPPAFEATAGEGTIAIQAQAPAEPGARCIGPHTASLRLEGLPAGKHTLSLRDQHGKEVATTVAEVAAAKP